MSGGHLTDHRYDLYRLGEWASVLESDKEYSNPVLAEMLRDLEKCLYDIDMTLSGDSGTERAEKAYSEYVSKWVAGYADTVVEIASARIDKIAEDAKKCLPRKEE